MTRCWRSFGSTLQQVLFREIRIIGNETGVLREAEIIAGLEHPGIIRAHGLGRTPAGGYFLALDWQPGGDLADGVSRSLSRAFRDLLLDHAQELLVRRPERLPDADRVVDDLGGCIECFPAPNRLALERRQLRELLLLTLVLR